MAFFKLFSLGSAFIVTITSTAGFMDAYQNTVSLVPSVAGHLVYYVGGGDTSIEA